MNGHAGFGTTASQFRTVLERWVAAGWPSRMAVETSPGEDGARWGLGLQVAFEGGGRFGHLLSRVPFGAGIQVLEEASADEPATSVHLDPEPGSPSGWWFHTGFTGPALFYRPADQACIGLLAHRRGPGGTMLDLEGLRARRWGALARFVEQCET